MTKKDYVKFAELLKNEAIRIDRNEYDQPGMGINALWGNITRQMADIFEEDNPRFNRALFLFACKSTIPNKRLEVK